MWSPPSTITSAGANIGLTATMLAIGTIVVVLRVYVRRIQGGWALLGLDDLFMLLSYIAFIALCVFMFVGVHTKALGYNAKISAAAGAPDSIRARMTLLITIFTSLALGLVRLSALFFFRRVFDVTKGMTAFRIILYSLITIVALWTVTFIVFPAALCGDHIYALWTPKIEPKYCAYYHDMLLSTTITDLILEIAIVSLPVPRILALQMGIKRRLAVCFVFLTALASVGASAGRTAIIGYLYVGPIQDIALANSATEFMWVLEIGLALIAVNLPSLWYLRRELAPESVLHSFRSMFSLRSKTSLSKSGDAPAKSGGRAQYTTGIPRGDFDLSPDLTKRDRFDGVEEFRLPQ